MKKKTLYNLRHRKEEDGQACWLLAKSYDDVYHFVFHGPEGEPRQNEKKKKHGQIKIIGQEQKLTRAFIFRQKKSRQLFMRV